MKVSRARSEQNRASVIREASRLFRERGFDGVGLTELMGAAGLTQGGFYAKFKSKENLSAQACEHALTTSLEKSATLIEQVDGATFPAFVRGYLSASHRDRRSEGCALAALGCDATRSGSSVRGAFEAGIKSHLEMLEQLIASASPAQANIQPVAVLSSLVGALLLSRIVEEEALSQHILDATAQSLIGRTDATTITDLH